MGLHCTECQCHKFVACFKNHNEPDKSLHTCGAAGCKHGKMDHPQDSDSEFEWYVAGLAVCCVRCLQSHC